MSSKWLNLYLKYWDKALVHFVNFTLFSLEGSLMTSLNNVQLIYIQALGSARWRNMLTDWAPTSTNNAGQTIEIQMKEGSFPNDTSLILALGIEFGMPVTNLLVNPIKH
jgi:hypothetical protein